jgi:hypothetical protein
VVLNALVCGVKNIVPSQRKPCALRAPTVFSVRMKSASVQKRRLWIKGSRAWVCFYPRSSMACGHAFRPYAIDDPRGRAAVRASVEMDEKKQTWLFRLDLLEVFK